MSFKMPDGKYYERKIFDNQFIKTMNGIESIGEDSFAIGNNAKAIGQFSIALGTATTAKGLCSMAEGTSTVAIGEYSKAEGNGTTSSGDYSHAEGADSISGADYSHAEGKGTITAKDNFGINAIGSHAEGVGSVTNNVAEHAEGRYNISNRNSNIFGDAGNTIHSIGIGVDSLTPPLYVDKKNAVEVMQNGDVYIIGIGGYDGTNYAVANTVQQVISDLEEKILDLEIQLEN